MLSLAQCFDRILTVMPLRQRKAVPPIYDSEETKAVVKHFYMN